MLGGAGVLLPPPTMRMARMTSQRMAVGRQRRCRLGRGASKGLLALLPVRIQGRWGPLRA